MIIELSIDVEMDSLQEVCVSAVNNCQSRQDLELDVARSVLESLRIRVNYQNKVLGIKFDFEEDSKTGDTGICGENREKTL